MRPLGFRGSRVPALKIDGRRVQGTGEISRELDRIQPEPPLFPDDSSKRALVEEAEAWGDGFQQLPRTIIWWALKRAPLAAQVSFLGDAKLGLPPKLLAMTGAPIVWGARRSNDSYDSVVRSRLAELPAALDKIDAWIASGVLNGEQLNAADFQIATSVRLLMSFEDLAPTTEARPAGALAKRAQPQAPGHVPPVFPQQWLEPLHSTVSA
jgi:glutathione S-transferase